ncbi:MAG TPA: hypothetical protein VGF21_16425 [Thermoleophilaceae bacterium]|jgi:hypothetical protein
MQSTWERIAPLTGAVFVVITVATFASGGSTPSDHDSALKVQAFYAKHHDKHSLLAFLIMFGVPFLLFFASSLRHDLRRAGGSGQLANAALAGGALAAAGIGLIASVHLALADAGASAKTLHTAQALNVLDANDFLPAAAGIAVLVFAAGLSAVRHGGFAKWLGWVGIVVGVLTFTPVGFFALLLSLLWIVVVSIMLTTARRAAPAT